MLEDYELSINVASHSELEFPCRVLYGEAPSCSKGSLSLLLVAETIVQRDQSLVIR